MNLCRFIISLLVNYVELVQIKHLANFRGPGICRKRCSFDINIFELHWENLKGAKI